MSYKIEKNELTKQVEAKQEKLREIERIKKQKKLSFNDCIILFLEEYKKNVKTITFQNAIHRLNVVSESFGSYYIEEITAEYLQVYMEELYKVYSNNYVEAIYHTLNVFFKTLQQFKLIETNPMNNVNKINQKDVIKDEIHFWTPEQFKLFCAGYQGPFDLFVYFNFLYFMGTRRGETIALQWKDVDLKSGLSRKVCKFF